MRGKSAALAVLVAAVVCCVLAAPAAAQTYEFTTVVDSAQGLVPSGCPAISNAGEVAFTASSEDFSQQVIARASGGEVEIIADDTGKFQFFGFNPSINDAGQVSFAAGRSKGKGEGIFVTKGGGIVTVARTDPGPFNFFGFDTSVHNQGDVSFKAELDPEFNFEPRRPRPLPGHANAVRAQRPTSACPGSVRA
jgi:hypothetical protein